jgi:hypothetical protein
MVFIERAEPQDGSVDLKLAESKDSIWSALTRTQNAGGPGHQRSESTLEDAAPVATILNSLGPLAEVKQLTLVRMGSDYHTTSGFHYVKNPFPVAALTAIMKEAKKLVCLELCHIVIAGRPDEFAAFADAIETQSNMIAFSLESCRLSKEAAKASALEPVVRALASSPNIGDITLMAQLRGGLGTLSSDLVGFLGRSPSLQALRLYKMMLQDSHIAALGEAMEQNTKLKILRLSCIIGKRGSSALARMVLKNTTLDKIDLYLDKVENEECTLEIASALQFTNSLKHYELDFRNKHSSSRLTEVYMDLVETKALANEIEFSPSNVSRCPFLRMMVTLFGSCHVGNNVPPQGHCPIDQHRGSGSNVSTQITDGKCPINSHSPHPPPLL